jgi:hypothetical protein
MGEFSGEPKLSPAEKVKAMAEQARKKALEKAESERAEAEMASLQAESSKKEQFENLKGELESLSSEKETVKADLQLLRDGMKEIDNLEPEALSDELKAYRAELEVQLPEQEAKLKAIENKVSEIEANPLFKEVEETEKAEKEAAEAREKEEKKLAKKAEMEKREAETEKERLEVREIYKKEFSSFAREVQDILDGFDEKNKLLKGQEREAHFKLAEARKIEKSLAESSYGLIQGLSADQKEGVGMKGKGMKVGTDEWFDSWMDEVRPSVLPFFDKGLKALRALREDARVEEEAALRRAGEEALAQKKAIEEEIRAFVTEKAPVITKKILDLLNLHDRGSKLGSFKTQYGEATDQRSPEGRATPNYDSVKLLGDSLPRLETILSWSMDGRDSLEDRRRKLRDLESQLIYGLGYSPLPR